MTYPSTGRFSPRALPGTRLRAALGRICGRPVWHLAIWAPLAVALMLPMAGCDDGKEAECRKAISNIRKIYGTSDNSFGVSPEAMVRSCQGSASPESVRCFIEARSADDLRRCEGDTFKEMFESEPGEPKPGEQKPVEPTPAEQKPAEQKPAEQTPAEQKPVEQTPAEPKPAEPAPVEQTPAGQTQDEGAPAQP